MRSGIPCVKWKDIARRFSSITRASSRIKNYPMWRSNYIAANEAPRRPEIFRRVRLGGRVFVEAAAFDDASAEELGNLLEGGRPRPPFPSAQRRTRTSALQKIPKLQSGPYANY